MFLQQEVWVGNEELVGLYEKTLDDAGYVSFKLARTNNRGDGMSSDMLWHIFSPGATMLWISLLIIFALGHSYDNTLPIHEHIKPKNSPRIFQVAQLEEIN